MSLILPKICSMGSSKTGLVGTIGVTLLKPDGLVHVARSVTGIYEIGGGCYGKNITFDDGWAGSIKWDTGGGSPVYATEEYGVEGIAQSIETDTNDLQTSQGAWLTATGFAIPNEYDARMTAIQNDLDDPTQYQANITGLATESNATINKNEVIAEVDANEVKIDSLITEMSTLSSESDYMIQILKNKRALVKTGNVWSILVYADNGVDVILSKELKDINGDDISDPEAGDLAIELKNTV